MSLIPQKLRIPKRKRAGIEEQFRRDGALTARKLREYVPTMLVNNLSVLLLITVDGLVLGNLVGPEALSAVNIFYPATVLIGVAAVLVSSGAATSIAVAMGESDCDALRRAKDATKRVMVVAALVMAVVQIPLVAGIITSYRLDDYMVALTWQYALCIMIATPFDLVSTVGTLQLQTTGKMRWLMSLSIMEGIVNLSLDLLFVGPLNMGAMGAGLGTACSVVLRCVVTVIVLSKTTDIYNTGGVKADTAAYKDLLSRGMPEAVNAFMLALQNYLLMQIVIMVFGADGGVIKGVCVFCFSMASVVINGIQGSMRPLVGIITGAEDWSGLRILFRQCVKLLVVTVGIMAIVVIALPSWFYTLHGVDVIPTAGELSLRLFALHFVFKGCNTLFRLYYANRKDPKFATGLTVVGNATLPLFAFLLSMVFPPAFIWLGYLFTETVILVLNLWRYKRWVLRDLDDEEQLVGAVSLSVSPANAVEASREIRRFADERGVSKRVAYRVALCMEEMVAYAAESQKRNDVSTLVNVRFKSDSATFTILDDGVCIALDEDREHQELITNNYDLVKCIAKEVDYQYVLDLNYTVMRF